MGPFSPLFHPLIPASSHAVCDLAREERPLPNSNNEPKHIPGSKVRLIETGTDECEYGIIICSWWNSMMDSWDYYVAFFGNALPNMSRPTKPYTLRYLETSLKKGWENHDSKTD